MNAIHFRRRVSILLLLSATLCPAGCGRLPDGRGWGQDVTLAPGWARVRTAAVSALLAPGTWVPVGAALTLQMGDADRELSEWATERTPVFGSPEHARVASDVLYRSAAAAYVVTALATPAREQGGGWVADKCRGMGVGAAAALADRELTLFLKKSTGRARPDGSDEESFPSGHASGASVYTTLASRNLEASRLSEGGRFLAGAGLVGLTAGTAWARVEGGKHFPSDVLAGIALGHFLGAFLNDAFLGLERPVDCGVMIGPDPDGTGFAVRWTFW